MAVKTLGETKTYNVDASDKSALDMLESVANVKKATLGTTKYVKCIEDVCASGNLQWTFYVNGKRAISPAAYRPAAGDELMFSFETPTSLS